MIPTIKIEGNKLPPNLSCRYEDGSFYIGPYCASEAQFNEYIRQAKQMSADNKKQKYEFDYRAVGALLAAIFVGETLLILCLGEGWWYALGVGWWSAFVIAIFCALIWVKIKLQ